MTVGIPALTAVLGVLLGRLSRRYDVVVWRIRAVEMARMNDVLMDRMEALENERQKED